MSKIKKINLGGKVYDIYDATAQRKLVPSENAGIILDETTNTISSYAIMDVDTATTPENDSLFYREFISNKPVPLAVGDTKVYINYELPVEQVVEILSAYFKKYNITSSHMGNPNDFDFLDLDPNTWVSHIRQEADTYVLVLCGKDVFSSIPQADTSHYTGYFGWNPTFIETWKTNNGLAYDGNQDRDNSIAELATDFHLLDQLLASTPFNIPDENTIYSVKDGQKFKLQNKLQAGLGINLDTLTNRITSTAIAGSSSLEEGIFYRNSSSIKFNTSLSEEEVLNSLASVEFFYDFVYIIAASDFTGSEEGAVFVLKDDGLTMIMSFIGDPNLESDPEYIFISTDGSMLTKDDLVNQYGFSGWNPNFSGSINFPANASLTEALSLEDGVSIPVGAENAKLNLLLASDAAEASRLYYLDNGKRKYLATDVIKEVNTLPKDTYIPAQELDTVPVEGKIKTIKIDTTKTKEEVLAILSQLTYQSESMDHFYGIYSPACYFEMDSTASDPISTISMACLEIIDGGYFHSYSSNGWTGQVRIKYTAGTAGVESTSILIFDYTKAEWESTNGWNPDFNGEIEANFVTTGVIFLNNFSKEERAVGNEILKGFITATLPEVNIKADKQEDIFYKVTKLISGTSLPVEGHLENIYFNTRLSTEEVVNLLNAYMNQSNESDFAFVISDDAAIVEDNFCGKAIMAVQDNLDDTNQDINFWTISYVDLENQSFQRLFSERAYANSEEEVNFAGWNPDFSGTINFDCGVVSQVSTDSEILVQVSQQRNEFFAPLISATPFESASDLVYFEDNKPHYLQEKLKAGNGISISEDGTISVSFETAEGNLF